MTEPIPLNPDVLRWARECQHMSLEDVAARMKKDVALVESWERGEAYPTYVQLEKLAYDIYKRPLALFFFPEPPAEETIEQTFRTLPEFELDRIPARVRILLRKARVLQLNLGELYDDNNPANRKIIRDLRFPPSINAVEMAARVRDYLGVSLNRQLAWRSADDAMKNWRDILEEVGVFVFKDTFNSTGKKKGPAEDCPISGFCLYDPEFPIIYVNNNKPKTRQIFTLFHELAHLLMHTGGVDTRHDDYIQHLSGDNKRIEVLCNRFAAEFLVPADDFRARSRGLVVDDSTLDTLAGLYCVSRETILRRFLDQGRIDAAYYDAKVQQWAKELKKRGTSGGLHFPTRGTYLGVRYVEAVFRNYHQGRISVDQAADYLGDSTKNVPGMENWLFKRGATT
jgi:Zn-dependent peptidase ImmA (M78 family)